jgi:hypothetical protein
MNPTVVNQKININYSRYHGANLFKYCRQDNDIKNDGFKIVKDAVIC